MRKLITKHNAAVHELIGLRAEVIRSAARHMQGISGVVVDETSNTFVLEVRGVEKRVPKNPCVFRFSLPGGEIVDVAGSLVAYSPVERPKKLWRKLKIGGTENG